MKTRNAQHKKRYTALLGYVLAFAGLLSLGSCGYGEAPAAQVNSETLMPSAAVAAAPSTTSKPTPVPTTAPERVAAPEADAAVKPESQVSDIPKPAERTFIGKAVCTAKKSVNIREQPSKNSAVAGAIPGRETADVIAYSGDWAHIVYNNTEGYVSRSYLIKIYKPKVDIPAGEWASVVINPANHIPEGFEVSLAGFESGKVDKRILSVCERMFADAKKDGISLRLVDAHRNYETQKEQYEKKVGYIMKKGRSRKEAEIEAAEITARPDTSEHQTGLALDIVTKSHTKRNSGFAKTKAFRWLDENAHNYGFTLRYKKDKASITKVKYEPWHWRFVGVKAAVDMKLSGQCLEEYFGVMD